MTDTPAFFRATITDAGGGYVTLLVDRDTQRYPKPGTRVVVDELDNAYATDDDQ